MTISDGISLFAERCEPSKASATDLADDYAMVKSYYQFRRKVPDSSNNIAEGFVMGLADFGCMGWQLFDLAGDPYDNEADALTSDWMRLGQNFENAREKIDEERR